MPGFLNQIDLEIILQGITQPPFSLDDLKAYLTEVELSNENLEFLLWYRRYCIIYRNRPLKEPPAPDNIKLPEPCFNGMGNNASGYIDEESTLSSLTGISKSIIVPDLRSNGISNGSKKNSAILNNSISDMLIPPHLPFASELTSVINTFFSSDSNLELNLPYSITSKLFKNLKKSTEPGIFLETYEHIYNTLNYNSFPKFMKFNEKKLTNINQLFNILLIVILAGLIIGVYSILFVFKANRWIRLICFPLWFLFFASILCAIYSVFNLANILGLFKSRFKSGEGNWVRQSIMSSNTFLKQRPLSMNKKEEEMTSFWSQSFLTNQQKNMSSSKLLDPIRVSLMPGGREQIKAISYLKLVKNRIVIISLIASLTCTIPFLLFPF